MDPKLRHFLDKIYTFFSDHTLKKNVSKIKKNPIVCTIKHSKVGEKAFSISRKTVRWKCFVREGKKESENWVIVCCCWKRRRRRRDGNRKAKKWWSDKVKQIRTHSYLWLERENKGGCVQSAHAASHGNWTIWGTVKKPCNAIIRNS